VRYFLLVSLLTDCCSDEVAAVSFETTLLLSTPWSASVVATAVSLSNMLVVISSEAFRTLLK
jgi:hypothetical protein